MRVVQVTPRFPPAVGGMENYVRAISANLKSRGHEVLVITSDDIDGVKNQQPKKAESIGGIPVYRYPLFFRALMREYWFVSGVAQGLEGLDPDVVHAHGYRCVSTCSAVYWCNAKKIPVVLTPHGIYPPRSWTNALVKGIFDRSFGNLQLRLSSKIIALTENNKQLLLKLGASLDRITVVPNGVDVRKYNRITMTRRKKEKQGYGGPILLYVGRIDWNKGLEKIIDSLPLLKREFPLVRCLIVGPDYAGYSRYLFSEAKKAGVDESVIMTGRVSEDEVLFYYSIGDIFVLPSLYEGLSSSLLEAMASHVPIIASRFGGSGDVLSDGVNALLLKDCSPEQISRSAGLLLRNTDLAERIVENAFSLVSSEYDWRTITDRIERLYMEACSKNRNLV